MSAFDTLLARTYSSPCQLADGVSASIFSDDNLQFASEQAYLDAIFEGEISLTPDKLLCGRPDHHSLCIYSSRGTTEGQPHSDCYNAGTSAAVSDFNVGQVYAAYYCT